MDDFRKPRPDDPILPSSAIFRQQPIKVFKRPKGRRGRKPRGQPLKPRGQNRNFVKIKEADEKRKGRELAIKQVKDKERTERENLQLRREQLRLEDQKQQDTARFRAGQVAREAETRRNQQALEDRRQRDLQNIFAFFQQSFLDAERRSGEASAQFQQGLLQLQARGQEVSRGDIQALQDKQAEILRIITPRGGQRPSPQAEAQRETTDITSRQLRRQRSRATPERDIVPSAEDQAEFNESIESLFAGTPEAQRKRRAFLQQTGGGGGSVRARPEGTPATIPEETLEERLQRQAKPPEVELSPAEQEEIRFKIYESLLKTAGATGQADKTPPELAEALAEAEAQSPPAGTRFEEIAPVITAQSIIEGVAEGKIGKTPRPAGQTPRELAEQLQKQREEDQAKVKALTARAETRAQEARGLVEPEPSPEPAGQTPRAFFEGLLQQAGGGQEEPLLQVRSTPYEDLLALRGDKKKFFSRKVRGQKARVFDEGQEQFVIRGDLGRGKKGIFAIDAIDGTGSSKQGVVYKDLSTDPNEDVGYGSIQLSALDKKVGFGDIEILKRSVGEDLPEV